jgi:hypothetical protein
MLIGMAVARTVSPIVGWSIVVVSFLAVVTVTNTLNEIFTAALYRYAASGAVPPGWTAEDFESVIKPRRRLFGRSGTAKPPAPPRPDAW